MFLSKLCDYKFLTFDQVRKMGYDPYSLRQDVLTSTKDGDMIISGPQEVAIVTRKKL